MTLSELREAIKKGHTLMWDDPDPINGADYKIDSIQDLSVFDEFNDDEMEGVPILIQYGGGSEAEVPVSEITSFETMIEEIRQELIKLLDNGDLRREFEKIREFDPPITIAMSEDENLDYQYSIDIEDSSYWYAEKEVRNIDYNILKEILGDKFSFVS